MASIKSSTVIQSNFAKGNHNLEQNLMFDILKVSIDGALASFDWVGKGDEKSADQAAVSAIRSSLNQLNIDATIVIGEGERDKAPMLYIGEKVGIGSGPKLDIALDPLEGTTICAHAAPEAMSVIAIAEEGGFLHAPDVYMEKIAIGPNFPPNIIDLDNTPHVNLQNIAKAKKCHVNDLTVAVLKRERHKELIAKIREAGAKIQLISDGDIASVISTAISNSNVDIYMGTGGAPEGVLAAAALRATGGQMMGRLIFNDDNEKKRAYNMGISDPNQKYMIDDLAKGNVIFAATGVTSGSLLNGIEKLSNHYTSHSMITYSKNSSIHYITSTHKF
ncbi:Fructose-1,6-bisphosphatase class 2 [Rickettsiales bacterium Ac37b]|nr:Fructose-1,6-bisphosphatase class 2 [Rickettsiales bacterium Ac37b]